MCDHARDYGRDQVRDHARDYGRDQGRDHARDYGPIMHGLN